MEAVHLYKAYLCWRNDSYPENPNVEEDCRIESTSDAEEDNDGVEPQSDNDGLNQGDFDVASGHASLGGEPRASSLEVCTLSDFVSPATLA